MRPVAGCAVQVLKVDCATICSGSLNEIVSGSKQLEVSGFMRLKRAEQSAVGLLALLQTAAHVEGMDVKGVKVRARVITRKPGRCSSLHCLQALTGRL